MQQLSTPPVSLVACHDRLFSLRLSFRKLGIFKFVGSSLCQCVLNTVHIIVEAARDTHLGA